MRNGTLAIALVISLLWGCADLQPIAGGVCGNLIVDPGEECDGDIACRPPGDVAPCRFDCSAPNECPPSLVCGTGNLCHKALVCGNGVLEEGEMCDGTEGCRAAGQPFECRYECTTTADCPAGHKCLTVGICSNKDVCGNDVVEAGEDCDGEMPAGDHACRPPGDPLECRFDCIDGTCPTGTHCGDDGICRAPSGTFTLLTEVVGNSDAIVAAHFDIDGRVDVLRISADGFRVHFFGKDGILAETADLRTKPQMPVVGDVDGDGDVDLAFRVTSMFLSDGWQMVVALSHDRSLGVSTQLTESLPGVPVAMDAIPPAIQSDLVLLAGTVAQGWALTADTKVPLFDDVAFGVTATVASSLPNTTPLGVATGTFWSPAIAPCEQLAVAWAGLTSVRVVSPCRKPSTSFLPAWNDSLPVVTVQLASGHTPAQNGTNPGGAIYVGDVDGDARDDLLVPTQSSANPLCVPLVNCPNADPIECRCVGCLNNNDCSAASDDCVCPDCAGTPECVFTCNLDGHCDPYSEPCSCSDCAGHKECQGLASVRVAYGTGNGSFDATAPALLPGDGNSSQLPVKLVPNFSCPHQLGPLGAPWLAVADLNQDGRVDIVNELGIYVTASANNYDYSACPSDRWYEAVTGDFDGNGALDVVASRGDTTLALLIGNGQGAFSTVTVDAFGYLSNLIAADFDGDTVTDVAFVRSPTKQIPSGELVDIMVAYGQPLGSLEAPVVVGRARDIEGIVAGPVTPGDPTADLVVKTAGANPNTAILRGSVTRQLLSSWVFRTKAPGDFAVHDDVTSARTLAFGHFAADEGTQRFVLAAMTERFSQSQRIEVIGVTDGEKLAPQTGAPFACTMMANDCPARLLTAIDLDGDGIDNVVAFSNDEIIVFGQGKLPTAGLSIASTIKLYSSGRNDVHSASNARPRVAYIDGDALADLAILADDGKLYILFGDGSGTVDPTTAVVIEHSQPISAFALLDNRGDAKKEIAVANDGGVALYELDKDGVPQLVETLAGVTGGDQLAAGDVDGDGIDDLIVGSILGFQIYRAEVKSP